MSTSLLPHWRSVLAVVAHPDDESFGLGGVLSAFAAAGSRVAVLCLTHGEASTLHGVPGDLHEIRAAELAAAAAALGARDAVLLSHPDGALGSVCSTVLAGEVVDAARDVDADGLVVFDPSGVTGHPDHVAATGAALRAADALDLPVLGWTLPAAVAEQLNREQGTAFRGHRPEDVDLDVPVDRTAQLAAAAAHASQALPTSLLWRRLELLGGREWLRALRPAGTTVVSRHQPPIHPGVPMAREFTFPVHIAWDGGRRTTATVQGKHPLDIATPPEFHGTDPDVWSPEDAFVAAAASCLAVTVAALAEKEQVPLHDLDVQAVGVAGRRPDGRFGFVRIEQSVQVATDEDAADRARALVEKAEEQCLVSVSLALPVQLDVQVRTVAAAER